MSVLPFHTCRQRDTPTQPSSLGGTEVSATILSTFPGNQPVEDERVPAFTREGVVGSRRPHTFDAAPSSPRAYANEAASV